MLIQPTCLSPVLIAISDSVLDSLLCAHLHTALLNAICVLTVPPDPKLQSYILTKALPSLIRALRNHLITIADFLWGWGSRSEPGTKVILDSVLDLEEDVTMDVDPPAIEVGGKGEDFTRSRARAALLSVYKVSNAFSGIRDELKEFAGQVLEGSAIASDGFTILEAAAGCSATAPTSRADCNPLVAAHGTL
jgi:hypothetical protein